MADPDADEGGSTKLDKPAPRGPAFAAGSVVANRYHIIRFIAEGGMGEVYEARDAELGERVALKTIRGELARKGTTLARFKREVHVARKVTHPNVCRVFDIGTHEGATFLTMQLLEGESLSAYLKKVKGRLRLEEVLVLARQIAMAVDAAHAAGVVHRDLKPGNVMLLAGGQVVVTDFGLARSTAEVGGEHDLSNTGDVAGSPAYMAPEQVEGIDVGPQADVYAFGIILYELVTGKRPFEGESSMSIAVKRLKHDAPAPRLIVPDLPEAWEAVILRCLRRAPAERFASAGEAVAALDGDEPDASSARTQDARLPRTPTPVPRRSSVPTLNVSSTEDASPRRPWWRGRAAIGGAAAVVAVLGGLGIWSVKHRSGASSTKTAVHGNADSRRRAVAIVGFKNLTAKPDAAWISTAVAEMLATELGGSGGTGTIRTLRGQDVARARIELSLPDTEAFSADTLRRIHENVGADLVVVGSYLTFGAQQEKVRVDVTVQDTSSGETVATISEQGTTAELPSLVEATGAKLRARLGLAVASREQEAQARASMPTNEEAARRYSNGLAKLRLRDFSGARDELEAAAKLDPDHPMIRVALAEAWTELGYDSRAREQAKLAREHADQLSPADRLLVEANYHLAAKEWDAALDGYRQFADAAPDDLDATLRLVNAQLKADRAPAALATLNRLRQTSKTDDVRIDLALGRAYVKSDDCKSALDAAVRAAEHAKRTGASLLLVSGLERQADAVICLGQPEKALPLIDEAERLLGDRDPVERGWLEYSRGTVLYVQGKRDEAARVFTDLERLFREAGSANGISNVAIFLGNMEAEASQPERAAVHYQKAVDIARDASDSRSLAIALADLADSERLQGDFDQAEQHELEALELARKVDDHEIETVCLQTLGQISFARGKLEEAERRNTDANALAMKYDLLRVTGLCELELGRIAFERDDLVAAREHVQRSLDQEAKVSQGVEVAEAEIVLANLALAEQHPAEASERIERALPKLQSVRDDTARATGLLAEAQLAAGKSTEARATAVKATAAGKLAYPEARIQATLAVVHVAVATSDLKGARAKLAAARAEADRFGLPLLSAYCELAQARLEHDHGNARVGAARLAALAKLATANKWPRLARLAHGR